ncbi:type II secretion system protein GspL [Phaeobacter italicus]|uniref:type II secretion system protein GspL n=1 Tax=Phaeobacter italicus TaxID=481446 RepID=UPI00248DDFB9|nr:type II secretion system protein GspL [Phaeobacter italicus]
MNSQKTKPSHKLEPPSSDVKETPEAAQHVQTALPLAPDTQNIHIVPAEHVSLHRLELPIRSKKQRLDALPFALEERIGNALEKTHFALCESTPDGQVLAAAIDKTVMDHCLTNAPDTPLIPEQMLLAPEPQTGDRPIWAVFREKNRLIIRLPDGAGFASDIKAFTSLWYAAGKPSLKTYGIPLPGNISTAQFIKNGPTPVTSVGTYDLRQGAYRPALGLKRPITWLAAGIALTALAHIALAIADLSAQTQIAQTLRNQANTLLAERFPNITAEDSPAVLQRQIMAQQQTSRGSDFLPLMDRVSQAWLRDGTELQIQQLSWSDNTLRLQLEARDLETLQQAEASLTNNALRVTSGAATADAGSARAEFAVQP